MTSNLDKWKFFMKDIKSPDKFIEMGFYYMIAAAMQRRVWLWSEERPLFPNLYVLLVAPPGVGKGLVTKPIKEILGFHKYEKDQKLVNTYNSMSKQEHVSLILKSLYKVQQGTLVKDDQKQRDENLMIPLTADSVTYEALARFAALSSRMHRDTSGSQSPFLKKGLYRHTSMCAIVSEAGNMFKKNTEDMMNFLLTSYDCEDFKKETKAQGVDRISRTCMCLLAGTTPAFVRDAFSDKFMNEGFASRTIVVSSEINRFEKFAMGRVTSDQLQAKAELIYHVRQLSQLFGNVQYSQEAFDYMQNFVEQILPKQRQECSTKLQHYFARKDMHVQKLATAIHFADHSDSMVIGVDACIGAVGLAEELEITMINALNIKGKNEMSSVAEKIVDFLGRAGPRSKTALFSEFYTDLGDVSQLDSILDNLMSIHRVTQVKMLTRNGKEILAFDKQRERNNNGTT